MALPDFSIRQLLEAGVHFGHQKHRWNPKMERFIFGTRNNIHIMDLSQTVPLLYQALQLVSDVVADGGRVLFVGTKRQAAPIVADAAQRSAQYYVNSRWLGGMLTNWQTISKSISRLRELEAQEAEGVQGLTKKELLQLSREKARLDRDLGGIKDMGNVPSVLFVIDTNKEAIAITEARRLGIPVVAVIDSNSNPDDADLPIPGNDDAARAIELYCDLIAKAALDGIARSSVDHGADLGAKVTAPVEPVVAPPAAKEVEAPKAETPKVEKAEPVEAAPAQSDASDKPMFTAPAGDPDDLKKISGVGPVIEKKLHALGITKYSQVADFSKDDIEKVDLELNFKGRIDRDNWLEQAAQLAKG
ncbi:SSU ribosomal protein S2p (SAe) [hydrothermal vent metagenome]|uniref:SSU ribosomal protein S2p (SAe) n=1 Tax=hydrothermal vent metagenome TaxID=652676 RepID=A0A3B0UWA1_9ZZZZ